MPALTICCGPVTKHITVPAGITVLEGLRKGGFPYVEAPCGVSGRCRRCLVEVTGAVSTVGERARPLLTPGDPRRLACQGPYHGGLNGFSSERIRPGGGGGRYTAFPPGPEEDRTGGCGGHRNHYGGALPLWL